ncbi:MAG: hypothetical protein AB7S26_26270 [Sandaracinaceae bacterium]
MTRLDSRAALCALAVLALTSSCTISLQDGIFACSDDAECPDGFGCRADGFCYRGATDGGMDARAPMGDGGPDASRRDADGPDGGADAGPPCTMDAMCDDAIACTEDRCVGGACVHNANDAACPSEACRTAVCDRATGCRADLVTSGPCDDGDFCNGADHCDATGACVASGVSPCAPPTTCSGDACVGCVGDGDCPPRLTCTSGTCTCAGGELAERTCADGMDNDCDGATDCADASCAGSMCGANGRVCSAMACACPGAQTMETTCNNGADDDCDGASDCADADCAGASCGANGRVCAAMACACPGGQPTESTCNNGADDDCDGAIDCADPDCGGRVCGANGRTCNGGSCTCPSTTEICDDFMDNDCDGMTDCFDTGCVLASCGLGRSCSQMMCLCFDCSEPTCDGEICRRSVSTYGLCTGGVCD